MKTLIITITVTAILFCANLFAAELYVNAMNPSPMVPYNSWATAAIEIQTAVDAASDGDNVIVTNGIYDTGGAIKIDLHFHITNRVFITKNITVKSVNGPEETIILGKKPGAGGLGADAIRGVRIEAGTISGFTISNGFTYNALTFVGEAENGAGVFCVSNNCIVEKCIITGNTAYDSGGGVYCYYGGNITDCKITENSTKSYFSSGGGITCYYDGKISRCDIINNSSYLGGGIMLKSGGTANDSFISENVAGEFGGGAYCFEGGTVTECAIIDNVSSNFGGGMFCLNSGGAFRRCRSVNNSAKFGAGACLFDGGALTNCLIIEGNSAEYGGGIYIKNNGAVHSCTIGGNDASQKGGGIVCSNAAGEVANSIFYHNSAFIEGNNWYVEAPSNLIFSYCCTTLANLLPGNNGCISDDPDFINWMINDYILEDFSPCHNAGFNLPWALAPGAIDLDHNPRIEEGIIDIGCYESIPEPFGIWIIGLLEILIVGRKLKL